MIIPIIATILLFDGPLPLPLPILPVVPTSSAPALTLEAPEHSTGYATQQAVVEDQIGTWTQPVDEWNTSMDEWLGPEGVMPETSGGDFTTGMSPLDDIGSIYDFAAWLGAKIGSLFEYLRAAYVIVQDFPTSIAILVTIIIACATFLLFCRGFDFIVRMFDVGYTLLTTLIQTIMEILPG